MVIYSHSQIMRSGTTNVGRIGGFFRFQGDPTVYALSNNHVIADLNINCEVNDPIWSSATGQVSGTLSHWVNLDPLIVNTLDVALMIMADGTQPTWQTVPVNFCEPLVNGYVRKDGDLRNTNWGYITRMITYPLVFNFNGVPYYFTNLIEISSLAYQPFSHAGDSGSLIYTDYNHIVGILLGGEQYGTKSYAIPFIDGILSVFPFEIMR